jgi:hypothetical protein
MIPTPTVEWHHLDSYICPMGLVERLESGEWRGRVTLTRTLSNGEKISQYARLNETFASAAAARGAVERTWRREHERNRQTEIEGRKE